MKLVITCIVMCFIWIPYRMSDYSKDSGFWQDYCVAFVGLGISALIYKIVSGKKDGSAG